MTRLLRSPRRTFYLSCIASTATGIAIIGFGAPPVLIAWVGWGGVFLLSMVDSWGRRRRLRR
jgi:hypothetical protein